MSEAKQGGGRTPECASVGDLAWEHGLSDGAVALWRVRTVRSFKGRDMKMTNWFSSKHEANDYIARAFVRDEFLLDCSTYLLEARK